MKYLPEVPTEEMLGAGWDDFYKYTPATAQRLYTELRAAAPEISAEPVGY